MRPHIKLKLWEPNLNTIAPIPQIYHNNLEYREVHVFTDKDGFITYENFIPAKNSIYILGGSFVESVFCRPGRRLPDHIDRNIKEYFSRLVCL